MADRKILDLKENKDPELFSTKRRPHLPINCVNLTLFNPKLSSDSTKELPSRRRPNYELLPSSSKLPSSLERRHRTWFGDNSSSLKLQVSYSSGKAKLGEATLPQIPTLRFYQGTPRNYADLPGNHSNGRQVNLTLRNSTNSSCKGLYSQRQSTAMDLKVVKTPLDSILCVSTWNYCMPLSARELNTETNSNSTPQRSPRYGHLAF